MARVKYNHRKRILNYTQTSTFKVVYPGMIFRFNYSGDNVFDGMPIVLVVWNDYLEKKIHGINLNYLTDHKIKKIFEQLIKYGKKNTDREIDIIVEAQKAAPKLRVSTGPGDNAAESVKVDKSDTPYKNIIKEPYTRLRLPTFKDIREGKPISKVVAMVEMKKLYDKVLKKFIAKDDMYRTYSYGKINKGRIIRYDIDGLLK